MTLTEMLQEQFDRAKVDYANALNSIQPKWDEMLTLKKHLKLAGVDVELPGKEGKEKKPTSIKRVLTPKVRFWVEDARSKRTKAETATKEIVAKAKAFVTEAKIEWTSDLETKVSDQIKKAYEKK